MVSFTKARKAQNMAALANGDISSLVNSITQMQQQISDMSDQITALNTDLAEHRHPYTDVDQAGTVLNKTTDTPS
jgi:peptidoglycan hydrolase CwlO-like protein